MYIKDPRSGTKQDINKIEAIRNKNKGRGLEECTFKPKLNKRARSNTTLRNKKSLKGCQTASSIQKYVCRMNNVREDHDMKIINEDKKVGSGKNWTHRITIPKEPTLSYKMGRPRISRKNASVERNISRELIARNVSLENIKTKDYLKEDEFHYSLHNHYYDDNESETTLQRNINYETLKRSKEILAEKMLENNDSRTSLISSQKSMESSMASPQYDFSKSSSNVDLLKNKALCQLSPKNMNRFGHKSPNPTNMISKPPLAPNGLVMQNKGKEDLMRINEHEMAQEVMGSETSESQYELKEADSIQQGKL